MRTTDITTRPDRNFIPEAASGAANQPLRALLLENIHPLAQELLEAAGFKVDVRTEAMTAAELAEALPGVQVLGIRSGTTVDREILAAAPELLVVGAFCIGTNQIDVAAAQELGITVLNAPFSNTRSVVELAVAEMLAVHRRLTVHDDSMHSGRWHKTAEGSSEIRCRTLGIVGYGHIGSQLSVVAEALGMRVVFHDVQDRLPIGNAKPCSTLREVLRRADVVSLHVDGRPENTHLIGAPELAAMRPGSVLLNLARGCVVDVDALRESLLRGHLSGAAVDVFPNEPSGRGTDFTSTLQGIPNVILTPHIAGSTQESQREIASSVCGKVLEHLAATGRPAVVPAQPMNQTHQLVTA